MNPSEQFNASSGPHVTLVVCTLQNAGVWIQWNGMVDWNGGLEWWNGLEWNGGMDWNGMVEWTGGMEWNGTLVISIGGHLFIKTTF